MGLNERILANVNTIFLLPKTFNHLVATTCIFVLIISSSYAAGENPQVDGELVQREVAGSSHLVKQLVRYANKQTKAQIKCWANNVKSIEWVKGDQSTKGVAIPACSEKKKNPEPDDIQRDDPCTSKVVTEEVMNGTQRVKEKRLVLKFPWVRTEDIGPYTCTVHPDVSDSNVEPFETTVYLQEVFKVERLTTESRHFDKGHRSVTVIAGNTLHIYCNVSGLGTDEKPSAIKMTFYKDGMPLPDYKNERNQTVLLKDKVVIRSEHWFDYLEAESHHRGEYKCEAEHKGIMYNYKFYVRVKDKLLPLWPFLGICGEVAVLCIIIVCYEKRRNKQELEESDTDGSPDQ